MTVFHSAMIRPVARCFGIVLLALGTFTVQSNTAYTQQVAERFGNFATDTDAPINIEADRLDVNDNNSTATFSGNVVATQDKFSINARQLVVTYAGNGQGTTSAGQGNITRIVANGGVLITSGEDQKATGDEANFDVLSEVVVLSGNVTLTSGCNVLNGNTLTINLKSGQSQLLQTGGQGRVRASFMRDSEKTDC